MSLVRLATAALALTMISGAATAETSSGLPKRSLFMSQAELEAAEALWQAYVAKNRADAGLSDALDSNVTVYPPNLHLAGLVTDGRSWSFWLNNQLVTPTNIPQSLKVNAVTRDYVDLVWHGPKAAYAVNVRLRPNQTYVASTNSVVEGKPR